MAHTVHPFPDAAAAARACAARVAYLLKEAISRRAVAHLALAGGNTPRAMYGALISLPGVDWGAVHFWWGDERCVPPGDRESNQRMARETLLSHIRFDPAKVHPFPTEMPPPECAAKYESTLRRHCEIDPATRLPALDILLLGIGADGHTLSLFPGSPALDETSRLVVSTCAPPAASVRDRATLTLPAARNARYRVLLASGADKRPVIAACLRPDPAATPHPAALVGESEWFLDSAAAP